MNGVTALAPPSSVLQEAAAGDDRAFAWIVAAYHADMLRVAYGISGDTDLARDAVQAAWLIAWRKLRTLREPERLRSWLVAIAANEARHMSGRRRSGRVRELRLDPLDQRDEQGAVINQIDLENALRRLKPDERALITLRYGLGLDSAAIGPMLGISAVGVRSRLMRLMARLRKELDDA